MQRLLRDRHQEVTLLAEARLALPRDRQAGGPAADHRRREGAQRQAAGAHYLSNHSRRTLELRTGPPGDGGGTRRESSRLMAAMSSLVHLSPEEARARLEERGRHLSGEIPELRRWVTEAAAAIGRTHRVEYLLAMLRAELAWTRGLIRDLDTDSLAWDARSILKKGKRRPAHRRQRKGVGGYGFKPQDAGGSARGSTACMRETGPAGPSSRGRRGTRKDGDGRMRPDPSFPRDGRHLLIASAKGSRSRAVGRDERMITISKGLRIGAGLMSLVVSPLALASISSQASCGIREGVLLSLGPALSLPASLTVWASRSLHRWTMWSLASVSCAGICLATSARAIGR